MLLNVIDFQSADTFLKLVIKPPFFLSHWTLLGFLRHRPGSTQGPETWPPLPLPSFLIVSLSTRGPVPSATGGSSSHCASKGVITLKEVLGILPPKSDVRNLLKRLWLAATGALSREVKVPFSSPSRKGVFVGDVSILGFINWTQSDIILNPFILKTKAKNTI